MTVSHADCPVPYAVVFRGPEITEINKSPEDAEAVNLMVLNARSRIISLRHNHMKLFARVKNSSAEQQLNFEITIA